MECRERWQGGALGVEATMKAFRWVWLELTRGIRNGVEKSLGKFCVGG